MSEETIMLVGGPYDGETGTIANRKKQITLPSFEDIRDHAYSVPPWKHGTKIEQCKYLRTDNRAANGQTIFRWEFHAEQPKPRSIDDPWQTIGGME